MLIPENCDQTSCEFQRAGKCALTYHNHANAIPCTNRTCMFNDDGNCIGSGYRNPESPANCISYRNRCDRIK